MDAHRMSHTRTDNEGRETWQCPDCPHVAVVTWPDRDGDGNQTGTFSRRVLVPGDESVRHNGTKGRIIK